MDINLLAISECLSLYYEILALMTTTHCTIRNCQKVRYSYSHHYVRYLENLGHLDMQTFADCFSRLFKITIRNLSKFIFLLSFIFDIDSNETLAECSTTLLQTYSMATNEKCREFQ